MAACAAPRKETRTLPLHVREFGETVSANESFCRSQSRAHKFAPRANTSAWSLQRQTSIHLRRHDEAQTRRRAGAVARWEMGRIRLRRCRSRGEQENLAFVDRASARGRITPAQPDPKP